MVAHKPIPYCPAGSDVSTKPPSNTCPDTEDEEPTRTEQLVDFIREINADLGELDAFYNISFSKTRIQRIGEYLAQKANQLNLQFGFRFEQLTQQGKVDYHMIYSFIRRYVQRLRAEWENAEELKPLFGDWTDQLAGLCEDRQKVASIDGKDAVHILASASYAIDDISRAIIKGGFSLKGGRFAAYRGSQHVVELASRLEEMVAFYTGYDPVFAWWITKPWQDLNSRFSTFTSLIREKLVGVAPGNEEFIVGQPIGRDDLLAEIYAEGLPYSPEELIGIAEREYKWCEKEAIKASEEMGYGKDWRKAQDCVKNSYVEPGRQAELVHQLAEEAVEYVEKHDMVTLPEIAKECWRTFMMQPKDQRVNPFFLGGPSIIVSYPTDTMSHEDKLMVMRGNNPSFSRSTVFHELLPGHHLQYHYMSRVKTHRQLFATPFWIEGWSFYWEMILWDRGFPGTPENRLGMLFWYMHRCARIVFSLKFHLGQMTPQECIDYLVKKVNHERATAEGEVRRSFNGSYSPLYQAGYMLGALQIYALRKEVVDQGLMTEKAFHDRIMKESCMPIELLRALLLKQQIEARRRPEWKFYGGL